MRQFYFCNLWEQPLPIFSSMAVYSQLNWTTDMQWQVVNCLGEFSYHWQQTDQHKAGSFYLNTSLGAGMVVPHGPARNKVFRGWPLVWICVLLDVCNTHLLRDWISISLIFKSHPGCATNCTEYSKQVILSLFLQIASFSNSFTGTFQLCLWRNIVMLQARQMAR